jgi:hypothetical protein
VEAHSVVVGAIACFTTGLIIRTAFGQTDRPQRTTSGADDVWNNESRFGPYCGDGHLYRTISALVRGDACDGPLFQLFSLAALRGFRCTKSLHR